MKIYPTIIIVLAISCISLKSQVLLLPSSLFINQNSRTGSMEVVNNSEDVKEVTVTLRFGYLFYDSTGNSYYNYNDSVNEAKYSLNPYLKVFPPKLYIPPGQRAVIRFLVRGIPDSIQQFYWTRVLATSTSEIDQIDSIQEGKINAKVVLKSVFNGLIAYLSGKNTSELDYNLLNSFSDSTGINLLFDHIKTGNSPFWGTMNTEIFDSGSNLVEKRTEKIQTYFSCKQKLTFLKDKFKPGKYKAVVTISNEREEIPPEFRTDYIPGSKTFEFFVK